MRNTVEDLFDEDHIVIYKCPKGHVNGIPFENGNPICPECNPAPMDVVNKLFKDVLILADDMKK